MHKLILTDVDETILRFAEPFTEWLALNKFYPTGSLTESYNIENWLGVDFKTSQQLMADFGRSEIVKNQPPEEDALTVLPRLYDKGYRFIAITACGIDRYFAEQRRLTIEKVFGFPFDAVHFVNYDETKEDILYFYRPTIWVEDNYYHALAGATLGHSSYLLDKTYNRGPEVENVTRVKDWFNIERLIQ